MLKTVHRHPSTRITLRDDYCSYYFSHNLTCRSRVVGIATTVQLSLEQLNPDKSEEQDDKECECAEMEERADRFAQDFQYESHS